MDNFSLEYGKGTSFRACASVFSPAASSYSSSVDVLLTVSKGFVDPAGQATEFGGTIPNAAVKGASDDYYL